MVVTTDMERSLKRVSERLALSGLLETERKKFWTMHRKTLRAVDKLIAAHKKLYAKAPGPHLNELEWKIVQGTAAQYVWNYLITRSRECGVSGVRPLVPGTVLDLALIEAGPLIAKLYDAPTG
jgi:hypothetical protein